MRKITIVCALLLTACSSDPEAVPRPSGAAPATSSSPTATPSAVGTTAAAPSASASADPSDLLVAARRSSGAVELYRVDRSSRVAARERVLTPPAAGARAQDVTLGRDLVCASWHIGRGEVSDEPRTQIVCYPNGSSAGQAVAGPTRAVELTLSDDGSRLAWADYSGGSNQVVEVARLRAGALSERRRIPAQAGRPTSGPEGFTGFGVQDLAWIDGRQLAISSLAESDDGPDLLRVQTRSARGWLDDGKRVPVPDRTYFTYDSVVSVLGTQALAAQRGSYMDQEPPPARAVRIDLSTGRVLEVIATADTGREVINVSGSRRAVVYVTAVGEGPRKAYLRMAGESRGVPITGLPEDARQVLTRG